MRVLDAAHTAHRSRSRSRSATMASAQRAALSASTPAVAASSAALPPPASSASTSPVRIPSATVVTAYQRATSREQQRQVAQAPFLQSSRPTVGDRGAR